MLIMGAASADWQPFSANKFTFRGGIDGRGRASRFGGPKYAAMRPGMAG